MVQKDGKKIGTLQITPVVGIQICIVFRTMLLKIIKTKLFAGLYNDSSPKLKSI